MTATTTRTLAELTTLRVGGPARRVVEVTSQAELVETVRELDAAREPLLVLGGGSNVLVGDAGFDGTVVLVRSTGVALDDSASCDVDALAACGGILLTVQAGHGWDDLVRLSLQHECYGLEALSGIPGLVGAAPIQNVGAYGQEVSQTLWDVRTYDRQTGSIKTFPNAACGFGYRSSIFKGSDRYVVLQVQFQLRQGSLSTPVGYAELARALGIEIGQRAPAADVRAAVLDLRRAKGMLLDGIDHDTWSAGSFFTNPVLDPAAADRLPAQAPRWPAGDGAIKTSAAWLIEHAGYTRGYAAATGRAALSTKHTLALTNRGDASATDLLDLAREVREGVRATFGVTLVNEPALVGVEL